MAVQAQRAEWPTPAPNFYVSMLKKELQMLENRGLHKKLEKLSGCSSIYGAKEIGDVSGRIYVAQR